MRIHGLKKYRNRNPKGYFEDLPPVIRMAAHRWLSCFLARREGLVIPGWLFGILVGQAKRLAVNPPTAAWGRSMLAKKGGKAVQRKYLSEGRHPTRAATQARYWKRNAAQRANDKAELRQRLGLGEPTRVAYLPLP